MRARTCLVAMAVCATTAGVVTATAAPAAAENGAAAHFVVLGPRGGSVDRTEAAIRDAGGQVLQSWPQIGVVVATSSSADFAATVRRKPGVAGAGASRNLAELQASAAAAARGGDAVDRVERIQPVTPAVTAEVTAAAEPLEPFQWSIRQVKADQAHAISGGSPDVLVGVLDSGIDASHPDLAANVDAANSVGCVNEGVPDPSPGAWAPTTSSHGTHVAGSIAADRNGVGVVGVAPDVRLASVKVVDDDGFIYPEYAICGFIWAAEHGMHVTNNSYFIDPWFLWCRTDPDQRAVIEAVRRAIDYSARRDVVNVVALGNSNWDMSHRIVDTGSPNNGGEPIERDTGNECLELPGEVPGVVGVSALGPEERKSFYSNYGISETDVTAPGGDSRQVADTPDGNGRVLSTIPGGAYGYSQGTSMASPHAAGVVALIRSTHPNWSTGRVLASLGFRADRLACPPGVYDPDGTGEWLARCQGGRSGRGFYGSGKVDALDAVTR